MSGVVGYFAYGSNLHAARLADRAPSSRFVCVAQLPGYRLAFHKRSLIDGSGKCNIVQAAETHSVWGAVYELGRRDIERLDLEEVVHGGYVRKPFEVRVGAASREVHAYQAPPELTDESLLPFDWYHGLVIQGARQHALPQEYIALLEAVAVTRDADLQRRRHYDAYLRTSPAL